MVGGLVDQGLVEQGLIDRWLGYLSEGGCLVDGGFILPPEEEEIGSDFYL